MSFSRLKIISAIVLAAGLLSFGLLRILIPHAEDQGTLGYLGEELIVGLPIVASVFVGWWLILRVLERRNEQLIHLSEAAVAIGEETIREDTASHVPSLVRRVVDVPYASLVVRSDRPLTESSSAQTRRGKVVNIPLVSGEDALGELEIGLGSRRHLSEPDRHALNALAALVVTSLERARLYSRIEELAIARERDRIRMDLHDGLTQRLYALGLQVEQAEQLVREDPVQAVDKLHEFGAAIRTALKETRRYVHGDDDGGRPVGLGSALRQLAGEFPVGVNSLHLDIVDDVKMPASAAADVLQLVREATANSLRHTTSTRVVVRVAARQNESVVSVVDDGEGFDPTAPSPGLGIRNMRERAESLGGSVEIHSAPGRGTVVRLRIPTDECRDLRK